MEDILRNKPLGIIVPFYGLPDLTHFMVDSIKTKVPYKILLIDNHPTHESKNLLLELTKDPKIEAYSDPDNLGVASSWNFGIKFALKQWGSRVFFLPNNDTIMHPDTIDILLSEIVKPESALITATNVSGKCETPQSITKFVCPTERKLTECPDFSCFMLKKETIDKIGYFDPQFYPAYFEDNDYHHRLKIAGLKAYKTNQAVYYHFGSRTIKQGGAIKEVSNAGYAINRDYYESKWGGLPGHETTIIH